MSRRRVRGSDGKLYNRKKQKDNGHRAHENRAQTALRRTRWRSQGAASSFASTGRSLTSSTISGVVWLFLLLLVRPARYALGMIPGLGFGRTSRRRSRGGR